MLLVGTSLAYGMLSMHTVSTEVVRVCAKYCVTVPSACLMRVFCQAHLLGIEPEEAIQVGSEADAVFDVERKAAARRRTQPRARSRLVPVVPLAQTRAVPRPAVQNCTVSAQLARAVQRAPPASGRPPESPREACEVATLLEGGLFLPCSSARWDRRQRSEASLASCAGSTVSLHVLRVDERR